MPTGRAAAIDSAAEYFDSGAFQDLLARRVAYPTESADPARAGTLRQYLVEDIIPAVQALGFDARIVDNQVSARHPFLVAHRREGSGLPTLLTYGHGDVQPAHGDQWRSDLSPWQLTPEGDRWYGRGTADNKGQHTVNLAALEQVLRSRDGQLGFNVTLVLDMGEESGSPGLTALCEELRGELAADLLVGSDGPRLITDQPTVFLGTRGSVDFRLHIRARDKPYHSGNWGGLLRNPATVLANAVASLVDGGGRLLPDGLRPASVPESVRRALAPVSVGGQRGDPTIDTDWGEPDLTPAERLIGWNALEVLAMTAGHPDMPTNAIPTEATVHLQLRTVVDTPSEDVGRTLREHLDAHGFSMVEVTLGHSMAATRSDPENPWVQWALESIRRTTGKEPALLPNLGGSLPNDGFARVLGVPTIWVPHSYPGCAQHAPNEHALASLLREGLQMMTGLFWDLGEPGSRPAGAA